MRFLLRSTLFPLFASMLLLLAALAQAFSDTAEPPRAGPCACTGQAVCRCAGGCDCTAAALTFPPEAGDVLVLPAAAVDGDTVDFYYLVRGRARLYGVNAPEVHSRDAAEKAAGQASKAHLAKLLPAAPVRAKLMGREKYGRALLELYDGDGRSLSQLQVKAGHAKPWDGKGPRP